EIAFFDLDENWKGLLRFFAALRMTYLGWDSASPTLPAALRAPTFPTVHWQRNPRSEESPIFPARGLPAFRRGLRRPPSPRRCLRFSTSRRRHLAIGAPLGMRREDAHRRQRLQPRDPTAGLEPLSRVPHGGWSLRASARDARHAHSLAYFETRFFDMSSSSRRPAV